MNVLEGFSDRLIFIQKALIANIAVFSVKLIHKFIERLNYALLEVESWISANIGIFIWRIFLACLH